jgi:hypothetical protein
VLVASKRALASRPPVAAGGDRWLLMAVRGLPVCPYPSAWSGKSFIRLAPTLAPNSPTAARRRCAPTDALAWTVAAVVQTVAEVAEVAGASADAFTGSATAP